MLIKPLLTLFFIFFFIPPSYSTIHTLSPNSNITLQKLISQKIAKPNDTIEYESGTYSTPQSVGWNQSMPDNGPITIRAKKGATVIFDCTGNTESYIVGFEIAHSSNYKVIGPFIIKNCQNISVAVSQANNVLISNFKIYNSYNWAIMASGNNVIIENNYIEECVTANKNCNNQWKQCVASEGFNEITLSTNFIIKNNTIINTYGEGIDITSTDGAIVSNNKIINVFPSGIYVDNGKNVIIEKNIVIHQSAKSFCEKYPYNFHSYSVASENWVKKPIPIVNITIKNNFAWGCSQGIGFWGDSDENYYVNLSIVHNTFFNLQYAAMSFGNKCKKTPSGNQIKNNFFMSKYNNSGIYINNQDLSSWDIGGNIYYGLDKIGIPDTLKINNKSTSMAFPYNTSVKKFFDRSSCSLESYNKSDVDINCYIPDYNSILYHSGIQTNFSVKDFYDSIRNKKNPSIGMFEGGILNSSGNKGSYTAVIVIIIVIIIIVGIIVGLFIYSRKKNIDFKDVPGSLNEMFTK